MLGTVTSHFDRSKLQRTAIATLLDKIVDSLFPCPTLLRCDLWKEGGSIRVALSIFLNFHDESMLTDSPIVAISDVLKVIQEGDGYLQMGELLLGYGIEATILCSTNRVGVTLRYGMVCPD